MERKYSDLKTFGMLVALFIGKIRMVSLIRDIFMLNTPGGLKEAKDIGESLFCGPEESNGIKPLNAEMICEFFDIGPEEGVAAILHAKSRALNTEAELREHLNRLHVQIEDKDDEITQLNEKIDKLEADLDGLNDERMQALKDSILSDREELEEVIRAQDTKIAKMEKIIAILMD